MDQLFTTGIGDPVSDASLSNSNNKYPIITQMLSTNKDYAHIGFTASSSLNGEITF